MKILKLTAYCVILLSCFFVSCHVFAAELSGRILLQVEQHGEAWYVSFTTGLRYFLGRPDDAFHIMREQGVGISDKDLEKIPIGVIGDIAVVKNSAKTDLNFSARQRGRIFLQVEQHGEAWYVNPIDSKRYFLGRPADAFGLMRVFGLGISDADIARIPESLNNNRNVAAMEAALHELINRERTKNDLKSLVWNGQVAEVARRHSANLAVENRSFSGMSKPCDLPLIHHEGFVFGYDHGSRLNGSDIYYFEKSGENIALMSAVTYKIQYQADSKSGVELESCRSVRDSWEIRYDKALENAESAEEKLDLIKKEIAARTVFFKGLSTVKVTDVGIIGQDILAAKTVDGWMNSPGHRKNILTADFDEAGIGVAFSDNYLFATQIFIKRASCGWQGGPCCEGGGCFLPATCGKDDVCRE